MQRKLNLQTRRRDFISITLCMKQEYVGYITTYKKFKDITMFWNGHLFYRYTLYNEMCRATWRYIRRNFSRFSFSSNSLMSLLHAVKLCSTSATLWKFTFGASTPGNFWHHSDRNISFSDPMISFVREFRRFPDIKVKYFQINPGKTVSYIIRK